MADAGRILIMPKGSYSSTSVYEVLDLVNHKGVSWIAKKDVNGIEPSEANSEYWFKMAGPTVANNLTTSAEGYVLDARQGKLLQDALVVERARINNITRTSNEETEGNNELLDIRVAYDGTVYEEGAGVAVRAQFAELKSDLINKTNLCQNNVNNLLSDRMINCLDVNDVDFLQGYGVASLTGNITELSVTNLTGYIPVSNGEIIALYDVGGNTLLNNFTGASIQQKLVFYDINKEWKETISLTDTPYDTETLEITEDGYIRIQYIAARGLYAYKSNHKLIESEKIDIEVGALNALTDAVEYVNCVDETDTDYLTGYGFSGNTGNIVEANQYAVTGFIPVKKCEWIMANLNGTSMIASPPSIAPKIAVYDKNKRWIQTIIISDTDTLGFSFDDEKLYLGIDGYVRIHWYRFYPLTVYKSFNAKPKEYGRGVDSSAVDVFMFMGQSNMAGRGTASEAPVVKDGAGYEFRAISDTSTLYPIAEPFGVNENKSDGIDDGTSKKGSMVSAFVNAYYENTGVPIVGVSASIGGTRISLWQPSGAYLTDAMQRLDDCVTFLTNNGYTIRHKYVLWCQGESDGDSGTTEEDYKTMFNAMVTEMKTHGIEKVFMVRIGNCILIRQFLNSPASHR